MASKKGVPPIVYIIAVIAVGLGLYQFVFSSSGSSSNDNSSKGNNDQQVRFSSGEKMLIESNQYPETFLNYKEQGIQAMAQGNYSQAEQHFEDALEEYSNSPETRIYLNNAKAADENPYEIGVTLPLEKGILQGDTFNFSLQLLRGYAHRQSEINQAGGIDGRPIQITIANDEDNAKVAKNVARQFANQQDVLAVTGHWSSEVALAAAPVYNRNQLVLVNPVSTIPKLAGRSNYVFTMTPNNFFVANTIADYARKDLNVENIAVFYDSESDYSSSLREELKSAVSSYQLSISSEFDFNEAGFIPEDALRQIRRGKAEAIVLLPSTNTIDNALQIVTVNDQQLPLIGDIGNLYSIKTLKQGGEDAVGMVTPIPWHIKKPGDPQFVERSRELWGGDVNWASVMAYDSMTAIGYAMAQQPTREGIQQALSSSNFSAPGVVERIQFRPNGDRDGELMMVEVQATRSSRSGTGYDFVPID